jgi:glutaminyl-tRNA synthetase
MTSKRKLLALVQDGLVDGWDDPRMPTLRGMRRRGYTAQSIRALCAEVGVAKFNSRIDFVKLENELRNELNETAPRRMGVLQPLKVVIENWPEGRVDQVDAQNNPQDESAGTRQVPFGRELWIERDDFKEEASGKYFRLAPGKEVRLRYAWYVTCTGFERDPKTGEVNLVRCTYDPESRGGDSPDGRKVKGTIHWVSAEHAIEAPVRLYDHLFQVPNPNDVPDDGHFTDHLNPSSLEVVADAKLEPSLAAAEPGARFQFERTGYFCVDAKDSRPGAPVFNRAVSLRDSWAKIEKSQS